MAAPAIGYTIKQVIDFAEDIKAPYIRIYRQGFSEAYSIQGQQMTNDEVLEEAKTNVGVAYALKNSWPTFVKDEVTSIIRGIPPQNGFVGTYRHTGAIDALTQLTNKGYVAEYHKAIIQIGETKEADIPILFVYIHPRT